MPPVAASSTRPGWPGSRAVYPARVDRISISPSASAALQATGMDAAGRRQYLYHAWYREAQEQAKYDRLVRFGELLPDLRKTAARHVRREPLTPEWTLAHAVTLINRAWFRVGSEQYARRRRAPTG